MTRWRIRRGHRRGSARGYTVMEVTIVAVLSSVLLIGLLRWLVGLGGVVNANLSIADNATMIRASEQFGQDILAATHCEPSGVDARIREVSDSRVAMVVDQNGVVTAVVWQVKDGMLQRGEADMTASGCAFLEPGSWTTWSRMVDPDATSFAVVRAGATQADGTGGLPCADEWSGDCRIDGVAFNAKNTGDEYTVNRVFLLN